MTKSNIWVILLPILLSIALMLGMFLGRITAGHSIQLEKEDHSVAISGSDNTSSTVRPTVSPAEKININTASAGKLATLPGIGTTLAKRIVEFREENGPFQSVDELLKVTGIGEQKLLNMIDFIYVGG